MKRLFDLRWRLALFRRVAPWIAKLSVPCPEVVRLASASCDRPLTWRERWRMRVHFLICDWCRRYNRQIHVLHDWAPKLSERAPQLHRRRMPDDVRARLKQRLHDDPSR